MRNVKRMVLVLVVVWVVFGAVCALAGGGRGTAKEKRARALELLDKYAATQDKLRSFVVKDVCKEVRISAKTDQSCWIRTVAEFRTDGNRVSYRAKTKSDIKGRDNLWWSWLWDGKSFIVTQRTRVGQKPVVIIRNHDGQKSRRMTEYAGATVMGIMGNDIKPIDSILRQAKRLSLQDKLEVLGESKCYVINAVTKYGKYTVWIDPEHGYNIAKAKVVKERGDIVYEKPLDQKYQRLLFIIKNIRFQMIDDVWVPMEADYEYNFVNRDSRVGMNRKHYTRTEIVLNPVHDALGSFVPDDISDGATVFIEGFGEIKYTWKDGKVVGKDGKVVDLDKLKVRKK